MSTSHDPQAKDVVESLQTDVKKFSLADIPSWMVNLFRTTKTYLERDSLAELSRTQRILVRNVRVMFLAARLEALKRVQLHAQALTYVTLLSLVPLAAVVFSIFKGFGSAEGITDKITSFLLTQVPMSSEHGAIISEYVATFSTNINAGRLGWVSILILVVSVLMLLNHIESSLNAVFGVTSNRPFVTRMLTYWSVLTFGPLLLAGSFALTAGLQTTTVGSYLDSLQFGWELLLRAAPLIATWIAFTTMYLVIPNTRVRFSSALLAAVVAGSLWNAWKFAYAVYAKHNVTQSDIYGSLAVIPMFVLWLYVSWLIVLFGGQLAFAVQHAATYRKEDEQQVASHAFLERATCRVFLEIAKDFYWGRSPTSMERLIAVLKIPRRLLDAVVHKLKEGGFVRDTEAEAGLIPIIDLEKVTMNRLLEYLRSGDLPEPSMVSDEETGHLDKLFADMAEQRVSLLQNSNFRELAARFS